MLRVVASDIVAAVKSDHAIECINHFLKFLGLRVYAHLCLLQSSYSLEVIHGLGAQRDD